MLRQLLLACAALGCFAVNPLRRPGQWRQVHELGTDTPSTSNCTWLYFTQKLDHFAQEPTNATWQERYCLYDNYWKAGKAAGDDKAPIFFYVGNESPVDEYVNNTGLMWNLGKQLNALIVFAEHRFEGESVPDFKDVVDCVQYVTTFQALADYVALIDYLKTEFKTDAPVIGFGGSYGGMLAGWMRIKYPDALHGAVAASAPILFAPQLGLKGVSGGPEAISRNLQPIGGAPEQCYTNLLHSWALAMEVMKTELGRQLVSTAAKQCGTVTGSQLLNWGQGPWFAMAEGNYPFPSTYITFSLGGNFPLPAWPMRVACAKGLNKTFGTVVTGSAADVKYNISLGDIRVSVDWDQVSGNGPSLTEQQIRSSGVLDLVAAMADAAGVWYNVTANVSCYSLDAPEVHALHEVHSHDARFNRDYVRKGEAPVKETVEADTPCDHCPVCEGCVECPLCHKEPSRACTHPNGPVDRAFAWGPICCNENLHNICYVVQGVGTDFYWPPNVPKNYTLTTVAGPRGYPPGTCYKQFDSEGLFGSPTVDDGWSEWIGGYYDVNNSASHTNIIWSNGQLDPWSAGGVYPAGGSVVGSPVQNLTADGSSVAIAIELGAHHLDLFFPTDADPDSVKNARIVEESMIKAWIAGYWADRASKQ
ncbi:putative serine protease pcp-1 [Diplonema papillatum]|nr:putative serine protease pcp-1 [Diplonema papillatum]KAJ9463349.1 putative serine protease pcp-1 [Diplonema papillatum]|eukprot:gene6263-9600_t